MKKYLVFISVLVLTLSFVACGKKYTVAFEGTSLEAVVVESGKTIPAPTAPAKAGYEFIGWYEDAGYTKEVTFPYTVKGNTTLYALYDSVKYTLSFDTMGGSYLESQSYYQNAVLVKPEDPVREGYRFDGWYLNIEEDEEGEIIYHDFYEFVLKRMPAHDMTVYAKWTEYVALSYSNVEMETLYGMAGDEMTLPEAPVKEGYVFDGWTYSYVDSKDETHEVDFDFTKFPSRNGELIANFHEKNNSVKVNFIKDDTTVLTYTLEENSTIEAPEMGDLSKEYYVLYGWCTEGTYDLFFDENGVGTVPGQDVNVVLRYIRDAKYAKVSFLLGDTVQESYILKGDVITTLPEYEAPKGCSNTNGFVTENGVEYKPGDKVYYDMALIPNIYSEGIEFEPIYVTDYDENDNIVTYVSGYRVVGFHPTDTSATELIIPDYYEGKPVTQILGVYKNDEGVTVSTFKGYTNYTSVVLPKNLTWIAAEAFKGCSHLTSVNLPNSLVEIGARAFEDCTDLATIEGGNGLILVHNDVFTNTKWLSQKEEEVESGAIYLNESQSILLEYTGSMPNGFLINLSNPNIIGIAGGAFRGYSELHSIHISSNVTYIGPYAFENCTGLKNVELPESLIYIGEHVFDNCSSLVEINIPDNVRNISAYAFYGCSSIEEIILPLGLTKWGSHSFEGCTSLASIKIRVDATFSYIPDYAFASCTSLEGFVVTDSVKTIGKGAFSGCTSMTQVVLGYTFENSVLYEVKEDAFKNCNSMFAFYVRKQLLIQKDSDGVNVEEAISFLDGALPEMAEYHIYVPYDTPAENTDSKYYVKDESRMMNYLEIYQSILGPLADKVIYNDVKAPVITVNSQTVQVNTSLELDVLAYFTKNEEVISYEDPIPTTSPTYSEHDKLKVSIYKVSFNGKEELEAIREGVYDFSRVGTYTVTVRVMDEYGNYATKSVMFVATEKEI